MSVLPEVIVDSFAGGGGASEGIERALRQMQALDQLPSGVEPIVNLAINHDSKALAMHAANHPRAVHLTCNIWTADPRGTVGRYPVGLLWASPDCRHHSKAKGGAPVSESVRGLANVIVTWAQDVRPRVIFLENVEEFADWGPLTEESKPDKARKGETFNAWVREFERMGYKVDTRIIRACDYGAPTIRKRLYVIMRCDGEPILWPPVSHGAPDSPAVQAGVLKPWRTAAEIIDWERACPSVLMNKEQGHAYTKATGTKVIRPLADNTERRIAQGIKRYVLQAKSPFIVTCNHAGKGFRGQGLDAPFATITKARDGHGLVVPHMMVMRNSGKPYTAANEPVHTVTAGGAGLALVNAALAPYFIQQYGERQGQAPRTRSICEPYNTVVEGGNGGKLAVAKLAPFLSYGQQGGANRAIDEPHHTVCASRKDTNAVVSAYVVQHSAGSHPGKPGHDPRKPLSTIVGRGTQLGAVAAHMISLKGRTRRAYGVDQPHAAITTAGQHSGVVSLPLLNAYYGNDADGADIQKPCRTISTRDRFGLVDCSATPPPMTPEQQDSARKVAAFLRKYDCWDGGEFVTVGPYVIVDIGMRMLTPRELARAQGFDDDYVLAAPWRDPNTGKFKPLTDTDQRHKIGNSVCPDVAHALIYANYRPQLGAARSAQQEWLLGDGWGVGGLEAAQ